jgi:hypothetical protein
MAGSNREFKPPPQFKTVPNLWDLPGARERAAESLGRHLAAQLGVRVRRVEDAETIGEPVRREED